MKLTKEKILNEFKTILENYNDSGITKKIIKTLLVPKLDDYIDEYGEINIISLIDDNLDTLSGSVPFMIYNFDVLNFYKTHRKEIDNTLIHYMDNSGTTYDILFKESIENGDYFLKTDDSKMLKARFAFEEIMYNNILNFFENQL